MSEVEKWPVSYDEIFKKQGIPEDCQNVDDYFFYEVGRDESKKHAGETYAIPRVVYAKDNYNDPESKERTFTMLENGAVIEWSTRVNRSMINDIGKRVIILGHGFIDKSTIDDACEIGEGVKLFGSKLGFGVKVGEHSEIRDSEISHEVIIGDGNHINDAEIGALTTLEDEVTISDATKVGMHSLIREGVFVNVNVKIGNRVRIGKKALINALLISDDSEIFEGLTVNKTVGRNTFVYPSSFKRAKKVK